MLDDLKPQPSLNPFKYSVLTLQRSRSSRFIVGRKEENRRDLRKRLVLEIDSVKWTVNPRIFESQKYCTNLSHASNHFSLFFSSFISCIDIVIFCETLSPLHPPPINHKVWSFSYFLISLFRKGFPFAREDKREPSSHRWNLKMIQQMGVIV